MSNATRDERLKAALRENLKRRKAQARGRTRPDEEPGPGNDQPGPGDEPSPDTPPRE